MTELWKLTLAEAAATLEAGHCSAHDLCASLLGRIRAADPRVRAFLALDEAAVLAAADASDARRRAGRSLSRFDGVPLAIKDNLSVAGQSCGCASKILNGYTAPYDATAVGRLREDRAGDSLPRAGVLANAPAVADDQFIQVPPVIEEETP